MKPREKIPKSYLDPKKRPGVYKKYVRHWMQAPLFTPQSTIARETGISQNIAAQVKAAVRQDMIPPLKEIHFPQTYFPKLKFRVKPKTAMSGIVQELTERIRRDPNAQLPISKLAKKYKGAVSEKRIIGIAKLIRDKFGGKAKRGGARIRYPKEVLDIILKFIEKARMKDKPVPIGRVIVEIARQTRKVVSSNGVSNYCKKARVQYSLAEIPSIGRTKTGLDCSLVLLQQAGLRPRIDFDMPKRPRRLALRKTRQKRLLQD